MNRTAEFINKVLFYGLFAYTILFATFNKSHKILFIILFPTLFVALAFSWLTKVKNLNPNFKFILNIGLWLNLLGEVYFFYHFAYYDKIVHFSTSFFITMILYDHLSKEGKVNKIFIFFSVLGLFAAFEIFEYIEMITFNYPFMGVFDSSGTMLMPPLDDTMTDLIFACFGSISYLIIKKNKKDKINKKILYKT